MRWPARPSRHEAPRTARRRPTFYVRIARQAGYAAFVAEKAIPLLTCAEIQPVVDFYRALGFALTFLQKVPYGYAVVERGDVERGDVEPQFYRMKGFDPAESLDGCYILTDAVETMHDEFRRGLKSCYGKIPSRGIPRIGPLKNAHRLDDVELATTSLARAADIELTDEEQVAVRDTLRRAAELAEGPLAGS